MAEHGAGLWEKWRAIVSEQIASGQSVAAFCKERGVTSSQVFAWKKRLREAEKHSSSKCRSSRLSRCARLGFGSKPRRLRSGSVEVAASRLSRDSTRIIYVHCWRWWSWERDRAAEFAHSGWCAGITDMACG